MLMCYFVKQNPSSTVRGSPPNGSSDKTIALPAAASWYMDVYVCTLCLSGSLNTLLFFIYYYFNFMAGELEVRIFKVQLQVYQVQMGLPKSPMLLIAYYHFPLQLQVFLLLLQYIVKQEKDLHLMRITFLIIPKVNKNP